MASAQTEPSMDEILASIRRIISEEDDAPQEVPVRQKLETLQLGGEQEAAEDAEEPEQPKPRARAKKAEPKPEPAPEPEPEEATAEAEAEAETEAASEPESEGGSDHVSEAGAQDDAQDDAVGELDDFEPLPEEPVAASSTMEPAAEAHDHGEVTDDTFDAAPQPGPKAASEAAPRPRPEGPAVRAVADAVRPAVTAAAMNGLAVSDSAAGQARNAFGALEENMRLSSGSGRTIEDLVEAMLTPMLAAWLDENLPRIVEDKVEEEVRRISRRR